MMEVFDSNKIIYNVPTYSVFHCRKIFHEIQKDKNEKLEEWFWRVNVTISECDFGHLTDYMLIDKFIGGLSEELFEKIASINSLTVEEIQTFATSNDLCMIESFAAVKLETSNDSDGFLSEGFDMMESNDFDVS